jgi:Fic family protein
MYPIPTPDDALLEARLLARLDRKKRDLVALQPLPAVAVQRLQEQLALEWIYNSNAIEGNTLTLQETRLILETGLTIGGKSLREHFEVTNHRAAIDYVTALVQDATPVTALQVRQIHRLVMMQIDDPSAGNYRQLPVRIAGAAHTPPDAWEVERLILEWGDWLAGPAQALHPVARAALAHHRLAAIHPFFDGNGRTARLVMNLLLLRDGYPPTVILKVNRQQYYRVLAQANAGRPAPFANFVGRAVERSLTLYLEACTVQTAPPPADAAWIPLREAAQGTPYSQEYLSLLARLGRLEAVKRGRNWYTTRRAVDTYQRSIAASGPLAS